jgi:gluconate 2-dehydrogenase alpha chain
LSRTVGAGKSTLTASMLHGGTCEGTTPLIAMSPHEAHTAVALFERIFPADEYGPGAQAIGVVAYVDRALAGAYRDRVEAYRLGLEALDRAAKERCGILFVNCGRKNRTP